MFVSQPPCGDACIYSPDLATPDRTDDEQFEANAPQVMSLDQKPTSTDVALFKQCSPERHQSSLYIPAASLTTSSNTEGQQASGLMQQASGLMQQACKFTQQASCPAKQASGTMQQASGLMQHACKLTQQASCPAQQASGLMQQPPSSASPYAKCSCPLCSSARLGRTGAKRIVSTQQSREMLAEQGHPHRMVVDQGHPHQMVPWAGGASAQQGQPTQTPSAQQGQLSQTASAEPGQPSQAPGAQQGQLSQTPNAEQGQLSQTLSAEQGQSSQTPSAEQGQPSQAPSAEQGQASEVTHKHGQPSCASADQGYPSHSREGEPGERQTRKSQKQGQRHGVAYEHGQQQTGVLRRKPGRGEATLSMSCSDKLAKWCCLGLQVIFFAPDLSFSTEL